MKCEILSFLSLKVGLRDRGAARMCSFLPPSLSLAVLPITFLSYRSDGASRKMLVAPATTATADSSPSTPVPLSLSPSDPPLSLSLRLARRRLLPSH